MVQACHAHTVGMQACTRCSRHTHGPGMPVPHLRRTFASQIPCACPPPARLPYRCPLCCRNLNVLGYTSEAAAAAVEVDALAPGVRALCVSETSWHSISVTWAAAAGYVSEYVVSVSRLVPAAAWTGIGVLSAPGPPPPVPRLSLP